MQSSKNMQERVERQRLMGNCSLSGQWENCLLTSLCVQTRGVCSSIGRTRRFGAPWHRTTRFSIPAIIITSGLDVFHGGAIEMLLKNKFGVSALPLDIVLCDLTNFQACTTFLFLKTIQRNVFVSVCFAVACARNAWFCLSVMDFMHQQACLFKATTTWIETYKQTPQSQTYTSWLLNTFLLKWKH